MSKVQLGQEVVSLLTGLRPRQLNQENPRALVRVMAVISAFLIVVVMALIFNFLSQTLESNKTAVAAGSEPVAFQPSWELRQQLSEGYLGK